MIRKWCERKRWWPNLFTIGSAGLRKFTKMSLVQETAVAQWLRRCATNRKVAVSIPAGVSGFFIDIESLRSHYGPGVDLASNRNECWVYFLGVKSDRCVRLTTYPHPVPLSRNLGTLTSWNPLGLSRPVMGLLYLYLYPCPRRKPGTPWIRSKKQCTLRDVRCLT
jgi:hypothetical protein